MVFAVKLGTDVAVATMDKDKLKNILFSTKDDCRHTMTKYVDLLENSTDSTALDFLSIFFASTWKKNKINKGNVCIALTGISKTLYIASNVNDDAGDISSCLLGTEEEELPFLHLFETDLTYRLKIISSAAAKEYLLKYISKRAYGQLTSNENFQNVVNKINESYPPRPESPVEMDSVVSSFCNVVYLWNQVKSKNAGFVHTMILLEVIALSSTSVYSSRVLYGEIKKMFFTDLLYYSVEVLLEAFLDSGVVFRENLLLHSFLRIQNKQRKTNLTKRICDNFDKITSKYKLLGQLKNCIGCLGDYDKYVYIRSEEQGLSGVLHCEIKLYLYLQQESKQTNIPFSISKPLCMDCAMYFFTYVLENDRPIFTAACTDHYANVLFCWSCKLCDDTWMDSHGVSHLHATKEKLSSKV